MRCEHEKGDLFLVEAGYDLKYFNFVRQLKKNFTLSQNNLSWL
jgi:hypothetical protein